MGSNGEINNSCGIEKNISSLVTGNDVEISFDYIMVHNMKWQYIMIM
jgi:hypothetical protein